LIMGPTYSKKTLTKKKNAEKENCQTRAIIGEERDRDCFFKKLFRRLGISVWDKVTYLRIKTQQGEVGVNQGCGLLEISKTSYYQAEHPEERFEARYLELKNKIRAIVKEHGQYGIRRIKGALELDYEVVIDKDVLEKLLQIWGLSLGRKHKRKKVSWIKKVLQRLGKRANLIRDKIVTQALQVITSDITQLEYGGGKAYLCVHKDSYAQVVYGWSLGLTMETSLVIASLRQAETRIKQLFGISQISEETIWHQDRGSQYTSYEYVEEILKRGRISYSDPGTPTDNPGQESFFGRFKEDNADEIAECQTFEELEALINKVIIKYNTRRIHTSIGYQPPMRFLKTLLKF